ncbi:Phox-like protein, partial [Coemansia reversa NRRL 1564]
GENLTVMRRYTDFELLREVLCERYRTFSKRIPTLPPKKAFGKFEDRFLKKRENGLQFFLAYVMLHPVIGCSAVIRQWL